MARSHPPTLIRLVERCLVAECKLARGARLLLAVSGGPDSMALLDVLGRLSKKHGFELCACGVDHGLRAAAGEELDLAEGLAGRWGVPFHRVRVAVNAARNVQAAAREARYAALRGVALETGSSHVVTAHHADDRAETVLMRLLRGSGPRGLAVLRARSGDLLRPMIRARRKDVLQHLERHGIACADDPSNRDTRFLRARIRHEVLPLLEALSPEVSNHLAALADQLGELGSSSDRPAELRDEAGAQIPLNREQAAQLRQALTDPRGRRRLHVLVSGDRELVVDERTLAPTLRHRQAGAAEKRAGAKKKSDLLPASAGRKRAAGLPPT